MASVFMVTCTSMSFTAIFINNRLYQELFCLLAVSWTQNFQVEEQIPGLHPLVCAIGLDQTVQVCHVKIEGRPVGYKRRWLLQSLVGVYEFCTGQEGTC